LGRGWDGWGVGLKTGLSARQGVGKVFPKFIPINYSNLNPLKENPNKTQMKIQLFTLAIYKP
jgi:hypothetical protein